MKKGLALSKRSESKGFTLVELLIVMGVLAVVVVTILVSLSPAEAGRKARDTKRMKDLAALEAIVLQYIQDGNPPICTSACYSGSAGQVQSQPCNNNWITGTSTPNLCSYTNSVPVDPLNNRDATIVCGGTVSNPSMCLISSLPYAANRLMYTFIMSGSDYKLYANQESKSNANNVLNDGGKFT